MEIKQSTQFKVPVSMVDSSGNPVTGLAFGDVTVYLQKQGGSSVLKTGLVAADWVEIDATNFPGVYDLRLSTTDTDTRGFIKYSVAAAGAETFIGILEVVSGTGSDNYNILAGRWKIDTGANQLVFYDPADDVTVVRTFDLKNSAGTPTSTDIFERDPV